MGRPLLMEFGKLILYVGTPFALVYYFSNPDNLKSGLEKVGKELG